MERHIDAADSKRDGLFRGLTLEAGLKPGRAWIAWLEEWVQKIEEPGGD